MKTKTLLAAALALLGAAAVCRAASSPLYAIMVDTNMVITGPTNANGIAQANPLLGSAGGNTNALTPQQQGILNAAPTNSSGTNIFIPPDTAATLHAGQVATTNGLNTYTGTNVYNGPETNNGTLTASNQVVLGSWTLGGMAIQVVSNQFLLQSSSGDSVLGWYTQTAPLAFTNYVAQSFVVSNNNAWRILAANGQEHYNLASTFVGTWAQSTYGLLPAPVSSLAPTVSGAFAIGGGSNVLMNGLAFNTMAGNAITANSIGPSAPGNLNINVGSGTLSGNGVSVSSVTASGPVTAGSFVGGTFMGGAVTSSQLAGPLNGTATNVTGSLTNNTSGNASTATYATTAGTLTFTNAQTIWVDPSGTLNGVRGNQTKPFGLLCQIFTNQITQPGDTIIVNAGTYPVDPCDPTNTTTAGALYFPPHVTIIANPGVIYSLSNNVSSGPASQIELDDGCSIIGGTWIGVYYPNQGNSANIFGTYPASAGTNEYFQDVIAWDNVSCWRMGAASKPGGSVVIRDCTAYFGEDAFVPVPSSGYVYDLWGTRMVGTNNQTTTFTETRAGIRLKGAAAGTFKVHSGCTIYVNEQGITNSANTTVYGVASTSAIAAGEFIAQDDLMIDTTTCTNPLSMDIGLNAASALAIIKPTRPDGNAVTWTNLAGTTVRPWAYPAINGDVTVAGNLSVSNGYAISGNGSGLTNLNGANMAGAFVSPFPTNHVSPILIPAGLWGTTNVFAQLVYTNQ